ncbi:glycerophosphodiester phosphodiesterase family protein [Pseudochryseolinea flava]|uniref:Glycerophosphodiester phosphodiesterase n=1 Tax=Pseudochryseolinea flava TaxID=2059302 RepID=A0A364XZD1_9BACT|nr:glycerophosphodiester phosphodiesterase family protein [Pseudochryseolinea flava]RAV99728.1 glycerophosphodiester phosphodiesterase [Pseudochryseolinea flava]
MRKYWIVLFLSAMATGIQAQYIPKFDVQGHRGARGLKPENTIPAFLLALDSGVTTLEMDVVITKDKRVVLSHEPWMSSNICLDINGKAFGEKEEKRYNIYQMTYDNVRQFDCGSKVHEKFPQQEKIVVSKPLLEDVIVAVENHIKNYSTYEVDYNIEIKSSPDGDSKFHPTVQEYSDIVYTLLDEYLPMERVVIQSFDFRVLRYWHEKYPEVRLAALVENIKSIDANLADLGFNPSIYSPYYKLLNKDKVTHLHRKKIRVIPWTVNETADMLALKGMGVDGFITDYPDRARKYKMTLNIQRNP